MKLHQTNLYELWPMHLHVIIFSINLLQPTITANAPTNETDRLALIKFKESITHDPDMMLSSWNDSMHFCNWFGITCGRRHQRVTALDLQGYKLQGSISPYISNLTFLRIINLRNNSFYGKIPNEVGHLFRLQELYLNNNTLQGEVPSILSNCSNARIIHFGWNELLGKIPAELGCLKKLERLMLGANNLTGRIPPSFGNLSSIRSFSLASNKLVGNMPYSIGHLKSLVNFTITANKISGTIPSSLYNISSLQIISISENQLKDTLPANIGLALPNLKVLSFGGNEFSGPIPLSLCNASELQILDLYRNNFSGLVPINLGNLPDLHWLGLSSNYLGRSLDFLKSLTNCSKLDTLDLSGNQFGGVLPISVGNLSTQLTKLYFGGNEISGAIPVTLGNLVNLIILGMEENLFTGLIPTIFEKFQKIQVLALNGNRLSGEIPTSIGNLTQLFILQLEENILEGSIPPSLGNCPNLQILDISQNNLSGFIPLIGLSSFSIRLNLSHNSFTGKLPFEVGNLKNINQLDISENNLSGKIPGSIGNCLSLEYLSLQGNSFEGSLPSSMAFLKGLQFLDISRNNLSGSIPKGLEKLPFLKDLNISFNDIEGEVPTEGVFKNASAISVIGNTKLCGGVPQLMLPPCVVEVMKPTKSLSFKLKISIIGVVVCFLLFSFILFLHRRKKSKRNSSSLGSTIDLLPNVSYKMLYQATNGFSPSNLVGTGSFGSVYKGVLQPEERLVAVKVLNLQRKGASKSFMAECNVLRNIRHRNLVKILTCCSSMDYNGNQFKALVFEFLTNGSLDTWLHLKIDKEDHSGVLSLRQRLNIAIDVACALDYLHNHSMQPIIHCDLKPSNILLDNDMIAHLSDFGLARLLSTVTDSSQKQTSTIGIKGSIGYAAPEYGMGNEVSTEGDVYSFGVFLLEMFLGKRPTDEMFKDDLNLHSFVRNALPERLVQIVDPALLIREVEEMPAAAVAAREYYNENEIEADEETQGIVNHGHVESNVYKCLVLVLEIGLACSVESQKERMKMEEVSKELHSIKNAFLGSRI
ncbi:probable LRR receptor-like serine/threonine-protein kinase At3g47570 isoform X2 [Quercus robur]|uniref:probable LRR receptor-like serine/threonine-protein kinase At3g47570 isoform X2 n=1 Tax=Quercus robur TaxID=38942 RepID=UPI0021616F66|nr:probable LRR receptor-like serine/threonine-protein kinase At3g47570 isoform X2 [Quercus robur]